MGAAGSGEPVVRTHDLRKRYGDLWAVAGIDLEIFRGECFAFLGPNGAGKTTTIEILAGFREPTSGVAEVLGEAPFRAGAMWHSRIGIVLQSSTDLLELKVAEAVSHFAGYYHDPRDPEEVIEAVGLVEKRTDRIGNLSGGQRRRLDVALGIIGRPELLFLDEPTTGFDPAARRAFWELIDSLKRDGTTILLTSHYLDEAERLADRVAVIVRGRVVACETPERLGGRQVGSARISWLEDGRTRTQLSREPTRIVQQLAEQFDGEVPELVVHRPSLEDVYLEMIADQSGEPGSADGEVI